MPTSPLDPKSQGDAEGTRYSITQASGPPPSVRYQPGVLLSGKYRLDALLGEGGMGAVWRATNLLLELPVAIKLIRADLDRSTLRARLQLEARAAAKLGHPAIVRVFDVGESEFGDPFIVMELLQGETLARLLTRGRLSGVHAVQLLLPIIDALGTAHTRGIVHRDLKPDNVMIAVEDQHTQPKILDFGIAKLLGPQAADHKLTEAGAVVGSPDYMSPEQARGREDLDAATDIWSLCVVLYEAVTGGAPFSASNYHALLRAIVEDEPRSIVEQAAGDDALWLIIRRGLAKDRRDRFGSMLELGQALAAWLLSHGVRDDAAGGSVESKWLGRTDPAGLAPRPAAAPGVSNDTPANLSPESHSGATGVARGPFTHTILPRPDQRKRAFGALAICGLLAGILALGIALERPAKAPLVGNLLTTVPAARVVATPQSASPAAQASTAASAAATNVPESAAAPSAIRVTPVKSGESATPAVTTAPRVPGTSAPSTHALSSALSSARANPAVASKPALAPNLAAAATSSTPRARSGERPLDLLAPY